MPFFLRSLAAQRSFASAPRALTCRLGLVCALFCLSASPASAARKQPNTHVSSDFARADQARQALGKIPTIKRTRGDYESVMEAFRSVYHGNPADPKADASIAAVADLLAEEGRLFKSDKSLRDAVGQYQFLRTQYPQSRFGSTALLSQAEIERQDLNDRAAAEQHFAQFLQLYPHSAMAEQAQAELASIRLEERGHGKSASRNMHNPATAGGEAAVLQAPAASRQKVTRYKRPYRSTGSETWRDSALTAQQDNVTGSATAAPAFATTNPAPNLAPNTFQGAPPHIAQGNSPGTSGAPIQSSPDLAQRNPQYASPVPQPSSGSAAPYSAPVATNSMPVNTIPAVETPSHRDKFARVTSIRHWSTPEYTRVAIDLDDQVEYEAGRVPSPDRIFFDLHGTRLAPELVGKSFQVKDGGFLSRVRVAQFSNEMTRVVLDVSDVSEYSAFLLPNPYRLIIDVHGKPKGADSQQLASSSGLSQSAPANQVASSSLSQAPQWAANSSAYPPEQASARPRSSVNLTPAQRMGTTPSVPTTSTGAQPNQTRELAAVSNQPNSVRATRRPTTAPVAETVAHVKAMDDADADNAPVTSDRRSGDTYIPDKKSSPSARPSAAVAAPGASSGPATVASNSRTTIPSPEPKISNPRTPKNPTQISAVHEADPTADGQRSLVRALGLKINRIVVDAGHGGHDSGTVGADGILEKDVVLDVSLRLGKLLRQRMGSDVIYTRDNDTFIPLETRTAIANKAQADLFISVHANSSQDSSARGVETYYLNFTASPDALEVAARENAVSENSIHQLSDLVKKIALRDKIEESHEFASDVEQSLYGGLEAGNPGLKDRGVKKAPFVVLIGANMPSILAEISFVTNPDDSRQLRDPNYRQRVAESLYRGVAKYINGLSSVRVAQNSPHPGN